MNVRLVHEQKEPAHDSKKENMIRTLQGLLRETCRLRNEGAAYAKLAHAQGYADGYMKLLVDGGFCTQRELLQIIQNVRRGVDGPATVSLVSEQPVVA